MSPLAALHQLLCQLFDVPGLRRFIRLGDQGAAITTQLPTGNVALSELVDIVVEQLQHHGLVLLTLARLQQEFPRQTAKIEQTAALWNDLVPQAPSAQNAYRGPILVRPYAGPVPSPPAINHARRILASRILAHVDLPATLEVSLGQRYTELEAEVEVEAEAQTSRSWLRPRTRAGQLRLEPSLVHAIERCSDEVILLEGEPGSGKTVSLRRVERSFAQRIRENPACTLPLPLYVQLKYLTTDQRTPSEQLMACILRSLDPDVDVARDVFNLGLRSRGWILLLDGFDEIPGVLSAIAIDEDVRAYALAIHNLYTEINREPGGAGRIVVATRHYHGPKGIWRSNFRLRPLSTARRRQFIENFNLTAPQVTELVENLATAPIEIQHWADNPLTLAMLCEVVQTGQRPPDNLFDLFRRYLELRFGRDAGRLRALYKGSLAQLLRSAEDIGFVMSAEPGLGLAPSSNAIRAALERHGLPAEEVDPTLAAIDGIDLVIRETRGDQLFTGFRHRRLQEYFATCVLLREPDRIPPDNLLFDARWREATVVLLQHGDAGLLAPLFERIEETLVECRAALNLPLASDESDATWNLDSGQPTKIVWPDRLYHLLSLLQAGFAFRRDLPEGIQNHSLYLLSHIYRSGIRMDKQYALEIVGALPPPLVEDFALSAFSSGSELLQDAAFKQIPRIGSPTPATQQHVSRLLVRMARSGKLAEDHIATQARIHRTNSKELDLLFQMASTAVKLDRTIRIMAFVVYTLILFVSLANSAVDPWSALVGGLLSLSPPLAALFIRDLSHRSTLVTRIFLDGLSILLLMIPSLILFAGHSFGVVWMLAVWAAGSNAYVWAYFMLIAVYHQLAVSRHGWPFIVPRLLIVLPGLPGAFMMLFPFLAPALFLLLFQGSKPEIPSSIIAAAITIFSITVAALAAALAARPCYLHIHDWITERTHPSGHRITSPMLRDALGGLRTGNARIRRLREVLSARRVSLTLDRSTHDDLSNFVVALENHALAIARAKPGGFTLLFAARIRFDREYQATCTSEHQRWCLQHCAHAQFIGTIHDMLDLLTKLLARAEQVVGGPRDE